MHELGHNFWRRHGGNSNTPNCKPDYLSVMGYLFSSTGCSTMPACRTYYSRDVGCRSTGDALFDGTLPAPYQAAWYAPSSGIGGLRPRLTPAAILQRRPLPSPPRRTDADGAHRRTGDVNPIDWNTDGLFGGAIAQDVNFDGLLSGSLTPMPQLQGSNAGLRLDQSAAAGNWTFSLASTSTAAISAGSRYRQARFRRRLDFGEGVGLRRPDFGEASISARASTLVKVWTSVRASISVRASKSTSRRLPRSATRRRIRLPCASSA